MVIGEDVAFLVEDHARPHAALRHFELALPGLWLGLLWLRRGNLIAEELAEEIVAEGKPKLRLRELDRLLRVHADDDGTHVRRDHRERFAQLLRRRDYRRINRAWHQELVLLRSPYQRHHSHDHERRQPQCHSEFFSRFPSVFMTPFLS